MEHRESMSGAAAQQSFGTNPAETIEQGFAAERIYAVLQGIVGKAFVSNRAEEIYLYGRDPGTMEPKPPDYVAMPRSTEEVQAIVRLANAERIPLVPMGGGVILSGLSIPQQGGIVLDMKRMNRILEVNPRSRYVLVEAGVSQGQLQAYLEKHYPDLRHSMPDAPPIATIGGNLAIQGSGHLSQAYGFHADMVNGLEAVLPTGEVIKAGSCSVSPYWFARAPLPDLTGLFLGWFGTTGIVTKVSLKLFPRQRQKDVLIFVVENPDAIPDILYRVTDTEVAEDVNVISALKPEWIEGFQLVSIVLTANSPTQMEYKRKMIRESLTSYIEKREGGFMFLPPEMKASFLEIPQKSVARFADVHKGGGFEYVGAIMPVEGFPEAYRQGMEIAFIEKGCGPWLHSHLMPMMCLRMSIPNTVEILPPVIIQGFSGICFGKRG
ncbi:MAG: FAD-binding oxidoreductase [Desulfitobacteriaceae bacterium]|nr:FAD-binding oxidoreductase [Desulfitobacteriaceae bacterium]MDI6915365.1 FAD-binding oxidoreductase [Desulfitobacteriaceae bacterium]